MYNFFWSYFLGSFTNDNVIIKREEYVITILDQYSKLLAAKSTVDQVFLVSFWILFVPHVGQEYTSSSKNINLTLIKKLT
jgi:hypothetical protein